VLIDIGVLESIRTFAGFRMIIFGGLVAALLIFRPRGLLDESVVHRIGGAWLRAWGWILRSAWRPAGGRG